MIDLNLDFFLNICFKSFLVMVKKLDYIYLFILDKFDDSEKLEFWILSFGEFWMIVEKLEFVNFSFR